MPSRAEGKAPGKLCSFLSCANQGKSGWNWRGFSEQRNHDHMRKGGVYKLCSPKTKEWVHLSYKRVANPPSA